MFQSIAVWADADADAVTMTIITMTITYDGDDETFIVATQHCNAVFRVSERGTTPSTRKPSLEVAPTTLAQRTRQTTNSLQIVVTCCTVNTHVSFC